MNGYPVVTPPRPSGTDRRSQFRPPEFLPVLFLPVLFLAVGLAGCRVEAPAVVSEDDVNPPFRLIELRVAGRDAIDGRPLVLRAGEPIRLKGRAEATGDGSAPAVRFSTGIAELRRPGSGGSLLIMQSGSFHVRTTPDGKTFELTLSPVKHRPIDCELVISTSQATGDWDGEFPPIPVRLVAAGTPSS